MEARKTRYAVARGGAHIAYQVTGDGPRDLVYVPNWASPIDLMWEHPVIARFLTRLASFSRLILFDKRGSGSSDNVTFDALATLEDWTDDIIAVMDAIGSERAAVVGAMTGVPIVTLFAASYPDRTSALVLVNPARLLISDDEPGLHHDLDEEMAAFKAAWGTEAVVEIFAPSMAGDPTFPEWLARFSRVGNPPTMATAARRAQMLSDVRDVLPVIRTPTLVLQRANARGGASRSHARLLATEIPGARLVEIPGEDLMPYVGETTELLDQIEKFLTGELHRVASDRVLATVVFTDIVGSTRRAVEMGDRRWRELLNSYHQDAKDEVGRFGGKLIKTTGDGVLATFDGPGRAINCTKEIRRAGERRGVEIRVGVHTGEVEVMTDDIGGIAVHIAARVVAHAAPGEVLVSSSVPPLVAGSGIEFHDRGEHELKGVPGTWKLFAV